MYEPFRAALEALRMEFTRAANRYPDLFVERIFVMAFVTSCSEPDALCQAFIEANRGRESETTEEWHTSRHGSVIRLSGSLAGIEEFKRLAESLHIVLCELNAYISGESYEHPGFLACLDSIYETASCYPSPLLRVKNRLWGVDNSALDLGGESADDLAQRMSPQANDRPLYPLHPGSQYLAHNVFTSAIAFIDTILEPDRVLLISGMFSTFESSGESLSDDIKEFVDSRSPFGYPSSPPISLPEEREGRTKVSKDGTTTVEAQESVEAKEPKRATTLVGEPTTGRIGESKGESNTIEEHGSEDHYIFRRENGGWYIRFEDEEGNFQHSDNFISLARLLNEPSRKMDALELVRDYIDIEREKTSKQSQRGDKNPQSGVPDDALDSRAISDITDFIAESKAEIQLAQVEHDIEKVEELTKALLTAQDILNRSTRDTEKRSTRRPRPLGKPGLMEAARKTVGARIDRAKKAFAERKSMPRFAQHLEGTVIPIRFEPKWVYIGKVYWKVKEVSTPQKP